MREILFRGKCLDNGEWVEGLLVHTTRNGALIVNEVNEYGCGCCIGVSPPNFEIDPATVGQFTGLLDKNGKRIFEGDICRVSKLMYKVEFKHSAWWFAILSNKVYCCPAFNSHCGEYCEVIGNIHDNPELLEGGQA